MRRSLTWTLALLLLGACGTTGGVVEEDLSAGPETRADSGTPDVPVAPEDLLDLAPEPDLGLDLHFDVPPEQTAQCAPGEGCFLDKCADNGECLSGWCVEHLGEGVCTQTCQEECPPGWTCKLLAGTGADPVYICVSDHANLCKPCGDAGDCKSPGGAENACLDYGMEGSFCGGACLSDDECPWGFSCGETVTVDGISTLQCVADAGVCPCTSKSIAAGLSTPCEVTNEFGTCEGQRVCTEEGLTDCDAAAPSIEECNGIDDDCDGEIDEPHNVGGKYIELCDDGNACTTDTCGGEGGCAHESLTDVECVDGDSCTVGDHCEAGICVGQQVDCDDGNPCTTDSCNPAGGCAHGNSNEKCDDGDACTVADTCADGECTGTPVSCDCQADADCAGLEDGDLCNGTLFCNLEKWPYQCQVAPETVVTCPEPEGIDAICLGAVCEPQTGKCSFAPNHEGFACEDDDLCTVGDKCAAGACVGGVPANCNDGNPCTTDSCDPATGCVHGNSTGECNDGDVCTSQDTCSGGVCVGGPALVCDDGDVCNGTESCDPAVGCKAGTPLVCSDGNLCNGVETCDPATGCKPGIALDCNDGNPCTTDSCDPATGCAHGNSNEECSDGNACTTGDHCEAGACIYLALLDCDDGNICTNDACDPQVGCTHKLNTAPCDDQNVCTTGDHCHLGECISSGTLSCTDKNPCTDDQCNPESGCTFVDNDVACDDGNACTENDACGGGSCKPGTPVNCNDGNVCTDDSCDPLQGCYSVANDVACSDGDACTTGEFCAGGICGGGVAVSCDDNNVCTDDSCHPVQGCVHVDNDVACSDGNACTEDDQCGNGACVPGPALECDDGNVCTTDGCNPATGCTHANVADGTPCGQDVECWAGECVSACDSGTVTFNYTGGVQTWVVPSCVYAVDVVVYGAQGSSNEASPPAAGPNGGKATGTLAVTPGTTLHVYVGGSGDSGGWNGGGGVNGGWNGAFGGGASDIRYGGTTLNDRKIVAGGAGAHPPYSLGYGGWHGAQGGVGGGLTGGAGQNSDGNQPDACGGGGGTQNNGGAAGCDVGGNPSSAGTFGQGGLGGGENDNDYCGAGGGGGGGWYGGGGGGHHNCGGGGGGGGSSYIGGVSNGTTEAGVRTGHGQVTLTW